MRNNITDTLQTSKTARGVSRAITATGEEGEGWCIFYRLIFPTGFEISRARAIERREDKRAAMMDFRAQRRREVTRRGRDAHRPVAMRFSVRRKAKRELCRFDE